MQLTEQFVLLDVIIRSSCLHHGGHFNCVRPKTDSNFDVSLDMDE